jgi:hypothetical protein
VVADFFANFMDGQKRMDEAKKEQNSSNHILYGARDAGKGA